MGFLNDKQISKLAENDIFLPFVGEKRRTLDNGTKAISYGLSQAGYDIRLSPEHFLLYSNHCGIDTLDPKRPNCSVPQELTTRNWNDSGSYFFLPPYSFGLGTSLELITMPDDVVGLCYGKSTYARCGVIINVTPIEPGWSGHLTMHIANPSPYHVRIYANEGIVQLMLYQFEEPVGKPYTGLYQHQDARVQLAAV